MEYAMVWIGVWIGLLIGYALGTGILGLAWNDGEIPHHEISSYVLTEDGVWDYDP